MIPCAGQGALAIEVRSEASALREMLAALNDRATWLAVNAERAVSRALGGSCSMPLAAHAQWQGDDLCLDAALGHPQQTERALLRAAARGFRPERCAGAWRWASRRPACCASAARPSTCKPPADRRRRSAMRVLVTRPAAQAQAWVTRLRERGIDAHALPLIEIVDAQDLAPLRSRVGNAVRTLARVLREPERRASDSSRSGRRVRLGLRPRGRLRPAPAPRKRCAALGVPPATIVEPAADAAQFDSEALWSRLSAQAWRDAQVLCVRGDGGRDWLVERLRSAGAQVECVSAYRRVAPVLDAGARQLLADALAQPARTLWWFSSSQAIDHLSALIEHEVDWSGARALVTHPRIATRARKLGFGHVDETRPASEDVLNAIERSIQSAAP